MGKSKKCIVLIPVYKEKPSDDEALSIKQTYKVLGNTHDVMFMSPEGLDCSAYDKLIGQAVSVAYFDKKYFTGIAGYNEIMLSQSFYSRFSEYEYMLICQPDAWVFSDQLDYWCNKNFDYIGAPWFEKHFTHEQGCKLWCSGNGGFSLRKISKMIEVTSDKAKESVRNYANLYEDGYFCYGLDATPWKLKRPSAKQAARFAFETSPSYLYKLNGNKLPFGCHAWRKYQYNDFWYKYIPAGDKEIKCGIITVTYNNLEGLKQTATSIINQTYKDYEWIVVDGGSTDGTVEYIKNLERKPDWWCSEKDNGIYDAQNKGIAAAKSEYLSFMNAGDIYHDSHVLENVFSYLPCSDVVYGDYDFVSNLKKEHNEAPKYISDAYFFEANICHQAMFIKRNKLKEGYDVSFPIYADWKKWQKLQVKGATFQYVPVTICDFSVENSTSAIYNPKRKEEYKHLNASISDEELQYINKKKYKYDIALLTEVPLNSGTVIWRLLFLQKRLEELGYKTILCNTNENIEKVLGIIDASHKILYSRPDFNLANVQAIIQKVRGSQILNRSFAIDLDDMLIHDEFAEDGAFLSKTYGKDQIVCGYNNAADSYAYADLMVVSTNKIKTVMEQKYKRKALVLPNQIDIKYCEYNAKKEHSTFNLLYASGTKTHIYDFKQIYIDLLNFMSKHKDVSLTILGESIDQKEMLWLSERVKNIPLQTFDNMIKTYGQYDLLLCPLSHGDFNDGKSNIKYIEAGAVGTPILAADVAEFASAIKDGINGYLYHDNFLDKLEYIYNNRDKLCEVGKKAYEDVVKNHSTKCNLNSEFMAWLDETR